MNKKNLGKTMILCGIFISGVIFMQCRKDDNIKKKNAETAGIQTISYGTSFGECYGYCKQNINITKNNIIFTKSGWTDEYKPVSCEQNLTQTGWDSLINNINLLNFMNLPKVIGCPDCADGGAEWIKIETADSSHSVTFEFGNEPEAVKNYISTLRDFISSFSNCKN